MIEEELTGNSIEGQTSEQLLGDLNSPENDQAVAGVVDTFNKAGIQFRKDPRELLQQALKQIKQ